MDTKLSQNKNSRKETVSSRLLCQMLVVASFQLNIMKKVLNIVNAIHTLGIISGFTGQRLQA